MDQQFFFNLSRIIPQSKVWGGPLKTARKIFNLRSGWSTDAGTTDPVAVADGDNLLSEQVFEAGGAASAAYST